MRIVLFDQRLIGHHLEYLRHLSRFAVHNRVAELHLVVHPHFAAHAPKITDLATNHPKQIHIHPLTEKEYEDIERTGTVFRRSLAAWKAVDRHARAVAADHVAFMEINAFQPVLGLPRARSASFGISGILFFPYCRIEPPSSAFVDRLRVGMERFVKCQRLRFVLSNSNVQTLFILNDSEGADTLNRDINTRAFRMLPDPVLPLSSKAEEPASVDVWAEEHWSSKQTHALLFGSLRRQKGVYQLLNAVHGLDADEAAALTLHVLGKSRGDIENDLPERLETLQRQQPNLTVHYEERFLAEAELSEALTRSDVVLAPYQRTEGSSGVIGHAANYNCPVIGSQTGLIGSLIREYDLGRAVDATRPEAIRAAIQHYLHTPTPTSGTKGMHRYVRERSPQAFSKTFFAGLKRSEHDSRFSTTADENALSTQRTEKS